MAVNTLILHVISLVLAVLLLLLQRLRIRYCTGGIRCEMASAYIRSKGVGFENVFLGPFNGILGFSQGVAMVALVCLHQQMLKGEMEFRFAILCSGFAVNMNNCQQGSINVPSLHIFGNNKGNDRQIENQASRHLASMFENGCSDVLNMSLVI